jgi:hypothetical protein
MMVYLTSTNWEDAYKKKDAQYQAVNADREQLVRERDEDKKEAAARLTEVNNKLAAAEKVRDQALEERKKADAALETIQQKDRQTSADVTVVGQSADSRRDQIKELEAAMAKAREDIQKEIEAKNAERKLRIAAEVDAKVHKARALDLETQTRELMKDLARARVNGGTAVASRKRGQENPPPDTVQGRIVRTDPASELLTISIGSDSGLSQGHTLQVYRLDPIPEQSRYLGTVEILTVTKNEAVARPVRKTAFPMKEGDRVAARILAGG